jgi:hypothetical protein
MLKTILFLLVVIQFNGIAYARQEQTSTDLSTTLSMRVDTYNLRAGSFAEALAQLAGEFKLPMGISWIDKPSATGNISFSWVGATVQEMLDEVVATQYGYRLVVHDGVVRVTSTEIPSSQNFLSVRINQFSVHGEVLPLISRDLQNQVRTTTTPPKVRAAAGGIGSSLAASPDESKIDLDLKNATVEDILDSLISNSDRKIWIVTFEDSFILTETGFRRALSLWSDTRVPDHEQPVWDLFRWGIPIPTKALRGTPN